ncbi:MAG: hypothetical protein GXY61_13670 [Lentisphaerae bacterium]|nr:hypothetical protein [Lentisphaerota bacterium]
MKRTASTRKIIQLSSVKLLLFESRARAEKGGEKGKCNRYATPHIFMRSDTGKYFQCKGEKIDATEMQPIEDFWLHFTPILPLSAHIGEGKKKALTR